MISLSITLLILVLFLVSCFCFGRWAFAEMVTGFDWKVVGS